MPTKKVVKKATVKKTVRKAVKTVKKAAKHKHMFSYRGGEAKCTCGKFLQPDGSITKTATGRRTKTKKKSEGRLY